MTVLMVEYDGGLEAKDGAFNGSIEDCFKITVRDDIGDALDGFSSYAGTDRMSASAKKAVKEIANICKAKTMLYFLGESNGTVRVAFDCRAVEHYTND